MKRVRNRTGQTHLKGSQRGPLWAARRLREEQERSQGMALIWGAIFMSLIIALVGLSLDGGLVYLTAHHLQNAADASCLAGAHEVRLDVTNARARAAAVALANSAIKDPVQLDLNAGNAPGGDIVVGRFDRSDQTFTAQTTSINAVQVTARRTSSSLGGSLPLIFGPIYGVGTSDVSRPAIAMISGGIGAGVIALNPTEKCAFDIRGTAGSLVVNGGAVFVNSDHIDAACHAGKPTLVADELHVYGDTDKNFDDKVNFDGDLYTEVPDPVPDPLAGLPEPFWDPAADLGTVNVNGGETITITPGYYSGGVTLRNGVINAQPGVYIVNGAGLDVNGGNLFANGVMFYIVDFPVGTNPDSRLDLRGNGIIELTPPDLSEYAYPASPDVTPYSDAAVSIFQARDNQNDSRVLGTNDFLVEGTLYFPVAHLEIGGTSTNFANGLIADTIEAHGNGELVINYDDRFPLLPRNVFIVK